MKKAAKKILNPIENYIEVASPVGTLILASNSSALTHLVWAKSDDAKKIKKTHIEKKNPILAEASKQLREYFDGRRQEFDLPLCLEGTEFQIKVWKTLAKIPYGKVWSYQQQAKEMGSPKAMRAVGGTNGKNPIAIIIPCHRVIGASGKLTGFGGGMDKKAILLGLEGHEVEDDRVL